jgi:hypothetical protein
VIASAVRRPVLALAWGAWCLVAACSSQDETAPAEPATTTGDESSAEAVEASTGTGSREAQVAQAPRDAIEVEPLSAAELEAEALTDGVVYKANPDLTMYVSGPWPVDGKAGDDEPFGRYQAGLTVVNTGAEPAEVDTANMWFTALRNGEDAYCGPPISRREPSDAPRVIEPGEAQRWTTTVRCNMDEPGTYEIRAFVNFEATDIDEDDLDLDRHFAGRYEIDVEAESPSS